MLMGLDSVLDLGGPLLLLSTLLITAFMCRIHTIKTFEKLLRLDRCQPCSKYPTTSEVSRWPNANYPFRTAKVAQEASLALLLC